MMTSFWLAAHPLVLASRSAGRRKILESAGIPLICTPSDIDERAVEAGVDGHVPISPQTIAVELARVKAVDVSRRHAGAFVLGCDQVLSCEGQIFHKATSIDQARAQLGRLAGRRHLLHSAAVLVKDGVEHGRVCDHAVLHMRPVSNQFIESYIRLELQILLTTVGGYEVEGLGIHLFESIEGGHSTVIGLPLIPVLDMLRDKGLLMR